MSASSAPYRLSVMPHECEPIFAPLSYAGGNISIEYSDGSEPQFRKSYTNSFASCAIPFSSASASASAQRSAVAETQRVSAKQLQHISFDEKSSSS